MSLDNSGVGERLRLRMQSQITGHHFQVNIAIIEGIGKLACSWLCTLPNGRCITCRKRVLLTLGILQPAPCADGLQS